jgi:hypothetical protein
MKKYLVLMIIMAAAMMTIACNSDKTELAFKNSADSAGSINSIVFRSPEGAPISNWSSDNGFAINTQTPSNEISKTTGTIECAVDNGGDGNFAVATVTISDTNSTSLDLSEGESYVYTLKAQ